MSSNGEVAFYGMFGAIRTDRLILVTLDMVRVLLEAELGNVVDQTDLHVPNFTITTS